MLNVLRKIIDIISKNSIDIKGKRRVTKKKNRNWIKKKEKQNWLKKVMKSTY